MEVADVFREKFEMPPLKENEAEELEESLRSQVLGYTTNSLGNFYFLDVTLLSSAVLVMKQKIKLKSLLSFLKMPAFEEQGSKAREMSADQTIQKKVDVIYYRAEDINNLMSVINKVLKRTGDSILTASKIIAPNQTLKPVPSGAD